MGEEEEKEEEEMGKEKVVVEEEMKGRVGRERKKERKHSPGNYQQENLT